MIKFPKIKQYSNVIRDIVNAATFVGLDENEDPIFDLTREKPTVKFTGTVKLHGTNAGVAYSKEDGIWAQSRTSIITPQKDNAGFAFFVESNKEQFQALFNIICDVNKICEGFTLDDKIIVIYGEWCGKGIQSGVSINNLEKMFVIFGVKIAPLVPDENEVSYWIDHSGLSVPSHRIFNITDFKQYEIDIDFNRPDLAKDEIVKLVDAVEKECPVGKELGVEKTEDTRTTGEGIVFTGKYKDDVYRFKAKGQKHSASKVKTIVSIAPEKLASIDEFIKYTVTENRLNQAVEQVFTSNSSIPDIKQLGQFIKWMHTDIMEEEMETLKESNLEPKDVNKYISNKTREWFMVYLNKQVGL